MLGGLGTRFPLLETHGFKVWPACGFTRPVNAAVLQLREELGLRAGDVEPITEFPFFKVLYGDPHAHLFALPIALLALAFILSIVLGCARWKNPLHLIASFLVGGLAIGALYPMNLSDIYT